MIAGDVVDSEEAEDILLRWPSKEELLKGSGPPQAGVG
jgi:hypothetical protein